MVPACVILSLGLWSWISPPVDRARLFFLLTGGGVLRKKILFDIMSHLKTTIIYESPHRILKTLTEMNEICENRNIVVIKELTKLNEAVYRGTIGTVINLINKSKLKGEFVIILDGKK